MSEIQYFPLNTLVKRVKVGFVGSIDDYYCNKDNGVRLYRTTNLTDGGLSDNDVKYVTYDFHQRNKKSQLHRNDILIARHGDNGKACVFENDFPAQALNVVIIEPDLKKMSPYLLRYMLESEYVKRQIQGAVGGSVQGVVNTDTIANLSIPIISNIDYLAVEQILTNIDAKIGNNNAICSNLEAMAKLLYDYWFVQFDFPDENGKPYKSSGGKMVWNEDLKREIPAGWEVKRVGDIISTERGISYSTPNIKTGEGVPMLNLATFMPGGGDYKADGLKHYLGDYPKNKVLKPYELIMCNTQQTAIKFETDIIGRAMLVPDIFDGDVVFSHHVNVIRTMDEDMKYYLLYLFNSDYYHKYISGFTNGTNILGLSFNGVEDYLTESPSAKILKMFGERVLEVEKKKSEIFLENQQLASLRDFLLPMLMNGQVKVG